jgi:hypothetical protein
MPKPVQPGEVYWIELENVRFQVRTVSVSTETPGWWKCATVQFGTEIMLPEEVLGRLSDDAADSAG